MSQLNRTSHARSPAMSAECAAGVASIGHVYQLDAGHHPEQLTGKMTGIKLVHVPYRGHAGRAFTLSAHD